MTAVLTLICQWFWPAAGCGRVTFYVTNDNLRHWILTFYVTLQVKVLILQVALGLHSGGPEVGFYGLHAVLEYAPRCMGVA